MATTTMAAVDNLLKEVYEPKTHDQLESEVKTLTRIESTSEGVSSDLFGGKYVTFPIRVARNWGIGARLENEALPIPRNQQYELARVKLKYLYGSFELTGQVWELADTNRQAFVNVLDDEIKGLRQTLSKNMNRQMYGTNVGVVATATSAGTTTTFVTTNGQYLEEGMFVDIFTSASAVRVADAIITDVSVSGGTTTATFSPAAGAITAVGDFITLDNSKDKEITGFEQIVDNTGTLYNLDSSVVKVWQSVVNDNSGTNRALSEGLMINTYDDIKTKGGKTTVIFSNLGVRRSYFNLLVQQRRHTNTQEFTGGFKGLAFTTEDGDVPMVSDTDAHPNQMLFLNEKELKQYQAGNWSFMDRDGSKWQRVINASGSFDAYQCTLYKYCELGTHRRNSHGILDDITEG